MHRRKTLLCISLVVLLHALSLSWAQDLESLLTAEGGFVIERRLTGGSVEEAIVPVNDSVMYVHGRSVADGKILLSVWDESADRMSLWLADTDGRNPAEVAADVVWSAWSPGGERFLYYDVDGRLYLVDNGQSRIIAGGVASASFSPDGELVAIVRTPELNQDGRASGLWVLEIASSQERLLTSKFNDAWDLTGYAPYWMPDGRTILFISSEGPTPFWSIDVQAGEVTPVQAAVDIPAPTSQLFWAKDGKRVFYGVEALDEVDRVWFLDFSGTFQEIAQAGTVAEGTPLGLIAGSHLLVQSEAGLLAVEAQTFDTKLVADASREAEISGSGLYRVKFFSPLANGVWRASSWFSHNRNRTDGGPYRYNCTYFGRTGHRGTDMAASLGRNIYAGAGGVVDFVSNSCGYRDRCASSDLSCGSGFGNYVRVRHSNGVRTYYAHMRAAVTRSGRNVNCRTLLGRVGSTGHSFGCHLHFEVRTTAGRAVDPYRGNCNWITSSLWRSPNNPQRCP